MDQVIQGFEGHWLFLAGMWETMEDLSRGVTRGDVNFRWDTSSYGEQTTVEGAGSWEAILTAQLGNGGGLFQSHSSEVAEKWSVLNIHTFTTDFANGLDVECEGKSWNNQKAKIWGPD